MTEVAWRDGEVGWEVGCWRRCWVWAPDQVWGDGSWGRELEVGWGLGAVRVEIPLFEPGAGSAASAGMTDLWAGMAEVGARV